MICEKNLGRKCRNLELIACDTRNMLKYFGGGQVVIDIWSENRYCLIFFLPGEIALYSEKWHSVGRNSFQMYK